MTPIKRANQLILDIDNSDRITDFQLGDGFILWLQIRYRVFKILVECFEGVDKSQNSIQSKYETPIFHIYGILKYYILNLLRFNPLLSVKKYEGLIFSSSLGTYQTENLHGFESKTNFFFTRKKAVLNLYFSTEGKYNLPYIKPYKLADTFYLMSVLRNKFFNPKMLSNELSQIEDLVSYLEKKVGMHLTKKQVAKIQNELHQFYRNYYNIKASLKNLFAYSKPKYIVVEAGNYGGSIITQILFEANRRNVTTIEVQHGILDIAYKYGKSLQSNISFADHKTNHLLTFGEYWNSQMSSTTIPIALGCPFLEDKIKKITIKNQKNILFVSQGNVTDSLIEIVIELSVLLEDEFLVTYRLHPNEIKNKEKYTRFNAYKNILISDTSDIYSLLATCSFVIGSYSAALFEAVFFGKSVFIHKNQFSDEYIPAELGERFKDANELLKLIRNNHFEAPQKIENKFWSRGWEASLNLYFKTNGFD